MPIEHRVYPHTQKRVPDFNLQVISWARLHQCRLSIGFIPIHKKECLQKRVPLFVLDGVGCHKGEVIPKAYPHFLKVDNKF
jgi:hypothetical protein